MIRKLAWGSLVVFGGLAVVGFVEAHGLSGTIHWVERAGTAVYGWVHSSKVIPHSPGPVKPVTPSS